MLMTVVTRVLRCSISVVIKSNNWNPLSFNSVYRCKCLSLSYSDKFKVFLLFRLCDSSHFDFCLSRTCPRSSLTTTISHAGCLCLVFPVPAVKIQWLVYLVSTSELSTQCMTGSKDLQQVTYSLDGKKPVRLEERRSLGANGGERSVWCCQQCLPVACHFLHHSRAGLQP